MAEFYSARCRSIRPLPWPSFAPPFSRYSRLFLSPLNMRPETHAAIPLKVRKNGSRSFACASSPLASLEMPSKSQPRKWHHPAATIPQAAKRRNRETRLRRAVESSPWNPCKSPDDKRGGHKKNELHEFRQTAKSRCEIGFIEEGPTCPVDRSGRHCQPKDYLYGKP